MKYEKRITLLKKRLAQATNPKTIARIYRVINHLKKLNSWGVKL